LQTDVRSLHSRNKKHQSSLETVSVKLEKILSGDLFIPTHDIDILDTFLLHP